jgi:hypothetical protein
MLRRRLFLLVCLGGLLWPAAALTGQTDKTPDPVRLDFTAKEVDDSCDNEWFGIYFQGKKIGYFNTTRAKVTEDGKTYYRETLVMNMKLQSFNQKSELKVNQVYWFEAKPPYRLMKADYSHVDDKVTETFKLVHKGKGYDVTIVTAGVESKKHVKDIDFTLADSFSSEVWLKRKPKKGDSVTTRDLEIEKLKTELSTTTLVDTKESVVNGVKVVFHEVKTLNHASNITSESRYDDKGHLISGNIAGIFEMRRETEEQAKNTEFSADLFILGLAKLDKGIGESSTITALVLEMEGKEAGLLPDGPRQKLVDKGNGVYHLMLGKKYGKQAKATEKEIEDALKETTAYPITDEKVQALAKKAIGDAKTDAEKVKRLCKFVNDFITPSLAANMPKMHDLMERKCGDCKSYALLFTCLARANGLPSREVSGFVYIGDSVKAFGGHAWNEVLLDGYWVPIDATVNETEINATHICLGTDKESSGNLLKTFGKLSFKLVSVEGGK